MANGSYPAAEDYEDALHGMETQMEIDIWRGHAQNRRNQASIPGPGQARNKVGTRVIVRRLFLLPRTKSTAFICARGHSNCARYPSTLSCIRDAQQLLMHFVMRGCGRRRPDNLEP